MQNGDAIHTDKRDRRFQLTGFLDGVHMQRNKRKALFLIKPYGVRIVVGGDELQPLAPLCLCRFRHGFYKKRADAAFFEELLRVTISHAPFSN